MVTLFTNDGESMGQKLVPKNFYLLGRIGTHTAGPLDIRHLLPHLLPRFSPTKIESGFLTSHGDPSPDYRRPQAGAAAAAA